MKYDHRRPIIGAPLNNRESDELRHAAAVEKWREMARRFEAGLTPAAGGIALLLFLWMLVGVLPVIIRHAAAAL